MHFAPLRPNGCVVGAGGAGGLDSFRSSPEVAGGGDDGGRGFAAAADGFRRLIRWRTWKTEETGFYHRRPTPPMD